MSKEKSDTLRISEDVIISIATAAINEINDVERIRPRCCAVKNFFINDRPVNVKVTGDAVEINADVYVKYGCNAALVAEKIQKSVKSDIQAMTGIAVSKVNVTISGIIFEKK